MPATDAGGQASAARRARGPFARLSALDQLTAYRQTVGHDPPEPDPADPLGWQWSYRGGRKARAMLETALRAVPADQPATVVGIAPPKRKPEVCT